MTREEQIRQVARKYFDDYMDGLKGEVLTVEQTFEDAAKWADKTQVERVLKFIFEYFYDPYVSPLSATQIFILQRFRLLPKHQLRLLGICFVDPFRNPITTKGTNIYFIVAYFHLPVNPL
jgi:hypothetical protein